MEETIKVSQCSLYPNGLSVGVGSGKVVKMLDFYNSDLLVNYHEISDELRRLYVLTLNSHPDESCREVGLPWEEDGLQLVQGQFTVGLLVLTLGRIYSALHEHGNHLREDFVIRLKSASICDANIRTCNGVKEIALSEFCS